MVVIVVGGGNGRVWCVLVMLVCVVVVVLTKLTKSESILTISGVNRRLV